MSCNMYVYVGAAAKVEAAPQGWSQSFHDLTEDVFYTQEDGNCNTLPYLFPNYNADRYGLTFDRYDSIPAPMVINSEGIADAVARFYDDHRESLFALSSAGFTLTV